MAFTFLKAKGYEIGKSLLDETKIDYCKDMMAKAAERAFSSCCRLTPCASRTSRTRLTRRLTP